MNVFKLTLGLLALFYSANLNAATPVGETVRILLMGDSTTQGGAPLFENSIEQIFANEPGIPPVDAINVGWGGETAFSLLDSGRYDRDIAPLQNIDYIFFRYGINDWFHRKPVEEHFRSDVVKVINRLREDFPEAQIILMTIIPFLNDSQTTITNDYIHQIAQEEGLELFDIHPLYKSKIQEFGKNALNVRFFPLDGVPQRYHKLLEPYTQYYSWKGAKWVRVQNNEFDPILGHLPGWYQDQHPNSTGYRFLADETVKFLLPKLTLSVSRWEQYDVDEEGWIDTGDWMAWLNITLDPWIWSNVLGSYVWVPISKADGSWVFVPKA